MKKNILLINLVFFSAISFSQGVKDSIVDDSKIVFEIPEVEASFPGGPPAWKKYLEKNLKPEVPTDMGAPAGIFRVEVRFIVDRNGTVSGSYPLTNFGYGMEKEVLRVLNNSGKWSPGMQNNRFVSSYHVQPVSFMITAEEYDISCKTPNILYTNADNEITIDAGKVKSGDLKIIINKGTITSKSDGVYIARVTDTTQRAVITIYNAKKNNKEIGATSFEVGAGRKALDAKKE